MKNRVESKEMSHLGLVAGMIDQLGLVEGIDSRVKQAKAARPDYRSFKRAKT